MYSSFSLEKKWHKKIKKCAKTFPGKKSRYANFELKRSKMKVRPLK